MVEQLRAYRTLVGVAMSCGLLIALVFETTRAPIEHNRAAALQIAIDQVLPGSKTRRGFAVSDQQQLTEVTDPSVPASVYESRNAAGDLLGYAIRASGMGYQDQIHLLYGYDPSHEQLTGFVVLDSRETPGLGSRISTDASFRAAFDGLGIRLDPGSGSVVPTLTVVRSGAASQPWEIDGITGATVSSRAVAGILNNSLETWLPKIHATGKLF